MIGKSEISIKYDADSDYIENISAESIRNAKSDEPLSLSDAVKVVEGLRGAKGISRSQILLTLRTMGASENIINLAMKRNSQLNYLKRSSII